MKKDEEAPLNPPSESKRSLSIPPRWPVVFCCLLTVSLVPVLAKRAMTNTGVPPLTLATIQLFISALIVWLITQIIRLLPSSENTIGANWNEVIPVGVCFGLKLAVMNVGLALSSTLSHVALASTEVFWSAACARCISPKDAMTTTFGKIALFGCALGAFFTAFDEEKIHVYEPYKYQKLALIANLAGPAIQGLVLALLRVGVLQAANRSHATWSTRQFLHPAPNERIFLVLDFTAKKNLISALVAACLAIPFQLWLYPQPLPHYEQLRILVSIPTALASLAVAATQLSFTALALVVSAMSIGVIGALKSIPQSAVAIIVNPTIPSVWQISGVIILLASAILWTLKGKQHVIVLLS